MENTKLELATAPDLAQPETAEDTSKLLNYLRLQPPAFVSSIMIPTKVKKNGLETTVDKPYMDSDNRQRWAFAAWMHAAEMQATAFMNHLIDGSVDPDKLAQLLATMGWRINCKVEKLECIPNNEGTGLSKTSYCLVSCYIRDPFGNEASDVGFCTLGQWPAFVEKASTKARARALKNMGFGTAFAIDMDDDELRSIMADPANMADGPVDIDTQRATVAPHTATTPAATPKPTAKVAPAPATEERVRPVPPQQTKPATTEAAAEATSVVDPATLPNLKIERNKKLLNYMLTVYPRFGGWMRVRKFTDLADSRLMSDTDVEKLRMNREAWIAEWETDLAANGSSLEAVVDQFKATLAQRGTSYEAYAAEMGVTLPQQAPWVEVQPIAAEEPTATAQQEEVEDPDPEGLDFDEEAEAPLDDGLPVLPTFEDDRIQREGDPDSPTVKQFTAFMELCNEHGGVNVVGPQIRKQWPWHNNNVRTQYLDQETRDKLASGATKPGMRMCWTTQQLREAWKFVSKLPLAGAQQAA